MPSSDRPYAQVIVDDAITTISGTGGDVHIVCATKERVHELRDAFRAKHPSVPMLWVTGDNSQQEKIANAESWVAGEARLYIGTSVALMGNDNSACRTVMIAGPLWSTVDFVQAYGRLRQEQRGIDSKVVLYLGASEYADHSVEWRNQCSLRTMDDLERSGMLSVEARETARMLLTPNGMWQFLQEKDDCLVSTLASIFHCHPSALRCRRCSNCLRLAPGAKEPRRIETSSRPASVSTTSVALIAMAGTGRVTAPIHPSSQSPARRVATTSVTGKRSLVGTTNVVTSASQTVQFDNPYKKKRNNNSMSAVGPLSKITTLTPVSVAAANAKRRLHQRVQSEQKANRFLRSCFAGCQICKNPNTSAHCDGFLDVGELVSAGTALDHLIGWATRGVFCDGVRLYQRNLIDF